MTNKALQHTSEKLESIQVLRAIVTFLILAFHMSFVEAKYTSFTWLSAFQMTGLYRVDLFFVISGFIITYITYNKIGQRNQAKPFLIRRTWRIISLYWPVLAVLYVVYLLFPDNFDSIAGGPPDILGSFLLTSRPDNLLLIVAWTLTYELCFYLIFCISFFIKREFFPWFLLAWTLVILALGLMRSFADIHFGYYFVYIMASPFSCEFVAGCLIALCIKKHMYNKKAAYLLYLFAALYLITVGPNMYGFNSPSRMPAMVVVCMALVFSIVLNENRIRRMTFLKPFYSIGNASYSMYLIHLPLLALSGRVWQFVDTDQTAAGHAAWIAVSIIVVVVCSLIMYRFIELPLLAIGKKLAPNKRPTNC